MVDFERIGQFSFGVLKYVQMKVVCQFKVLIIMNLIAILVGLIKCIT